MPEDTYELFRRALVERDADAWEDIVSCYRKMLIAWAARCPATEASGERSENLADEALARAWTALSPERFVSFPNLAALLAYLRACVHTTVIDAARGHAIYNRAFQHVERDAGPPPEQIVLERLGRTELWRLITSLTTSEAERIVLYERFVLGLPPRVIQARHPALFPDVTLVYAAIRNLLDRLRRHTGLRQLYDGDLAA